MSSAFSEEVRNIVGPMLQQRGFLEDGIDDSPDPGGLGRHIVYYRSKDCKLQIFSYAREGEINCMVGPLTALNEFGPNSKAWRYLNEFTEEYKLPLKQFFEVMNDDYNSYKNPLDWLRDRIDRNLDAACAGIAASPPASD